MLNKSITWFIRLPNDKQLLYTNIFVTLVLMFFIITFMFFIEIPSVTAFLVGVVITYITIVIKLTVELIQGRIIFTEDLKNFLDKEKE